jgi:hypothetical protein
MDVRQFNQRRPVDTDDRTVAQQELEPRRAVIRQHEVGRDEVGRDVVVCRDHAVSGREKRLQTRDPVDRSGISPAQIPRAIVQLHDQVDGHSQQGGDEIDADGIE